MVHVLWDASSLVKRYYNETGSETVDAVFASTQAADMATTALGYAECASILRRRFNSFVLNQAAFSSARYMLRQEVLSSRGFRLIPMNDGVTLDGVAWIDAYNINASDAAILETYLRHAREVGNSCLLVASDGRLLRAAAAEGLKTLNPELVPAADIPAFLAAL